jgi:SAM-dependent methyltransferase
MHDDYALTLSDDFALSRPIGVPKTSTEEVSKSALRGNPSFVWRFGQERRLNMIAAYANLQNARILVDGCGIGAYVARLRDFSPTVYGLDIDGDNIAVGARTLSSALKVADAEHLPYPDNTFDTILSHEVIEHIPNDRAAAREMARVLKPGGRLVLFCPNRWYPFETHGHYWHGHYHFGNTPLINYLPRRWRDQLAPHVRAYSAKDLRRLFARLPLRVVYHTRIMAGYDNIVARFPTFGKLLRFSTYAAEHTPLRILGLSHFLVMEKG